MPARAVLVLATILAAAATSACRLRLPPPPATFSMGRSAKVARFGLPSYEKNKKLTKNAAAAQQPSGKIQKPAPKAKKAASKGQAKAKKKS